MGEICLIVHSDGDEDSMIDGCYDSKPPWRKLQCNSLPADESCKKYPLMNKAFLGNVSSCLIRS